jgi:hypothetical protein
MAVKTLSKYGHNLMPKGRSIVGRGSDLMRSAGEFDILNNDSCNTPEVKGVLRKAEAGD